MPFGLGPCCRGFLLCERWGDEANLLGKDLSPSTVDFEEDLFLPVVDSFLSTESTLGRDKISRETHSCQEVEGGRKVTRLFASTARFFIS